MRQGSITVHAYDGRYFVALHLDGHAFFSLSGPSEARAQLEVLARLANHTKEKAPAPKSEG